MTIAAGVAKQVTYKQESAWGVAPGASAGQSLRRVTSDLALNKETYQSEEILPTYQLSDMRHGVRSVGGGINGEFSPGTWKDFMAAAVRKAYAAVTALTGLSITVAGAGPTYTLTRGSGDYLAGGAKVGHVVRLTAGSFNAANLNKNLFVLAVTATILTVMPLNGVALVAEGPIATATVTWPGKVAFAPATGQTDLSFAIEHWHPDISISELFLGLKIDTMDIELPPTGIAKINLGFMGKDMTPAAAQYLTSPTAATTSGVLAAVNGLLIAQGAAIALMTGLTLNYKGEMAAEPVVGSNTYADIAEGRVLIGGQATLLFQDATFRDYFLNETEVSMAVALATSTAAAADFVGITLPRVKFGGAGRDDGRKNLILTMPFTALYNGAGGAGISSEQTTINFQDSLA